MGTKKNAIERRRSTILIILKSHPIVLFKNIEAKFASTIINYGAFELHFKN